MDGIELAEPNPALAAFKKRDAVLGQLATKYTGLKINGISDRAGLKIVHEARMEVKAARLSIEKDRKALKENVLEYGRQVDAEAKRLTGIVAPIEEALEREEDAVENEKLRIKMAEEKARQDRIRVRYEAFAAIHEAPPAGLDGMTDEDYQVAYANAKLEEGRKAAAVALEAKRLADEAEARRLEREELDRIRAAQDAIRKDQESKAAELAAHQQRIAEQEAQQRRAAELEEAKKLAAEQAVVVEKERAARLKRESDEYEAQRLAENARLAKEEAAAKAKAEAEKPMREKINCLAALIEQYQAIWIDTKTVNVALAKCGRELRKIASGTLE